MILYEGAITNRVQTMIMDLFTICKARLHEFLIFILELDQVAVDETRSHEVSLDIGLTHKKIRDHIFEETQTPWIVKKTNMTQSFMPMRLAITRTMMKRKMKRKFYLVC